MIRFGLIALLIAFGVAVTIPSYADGSGVKGGIGAVKGKGATVFRTSPKGKR